MKKEFIYTAEKEPTAVLVAVATRQQNAEQVKEYLDELAFLATTLGVRTVRTFTQNLDQPDSRFFVGKGKLQDIVAYVKENDVDIVIFDDDLTSSHVKNLDRELTGCLVIDRSLLILQIFMRRARTAQAKLQVELAQYQYMLPRLINLWTHHSRQRGGIGLRGPGESELETDKRIIRDRIAFLKEKLEKLDRQSTVRRKARDGNVRVALVGYTNAGKSTLMNLLCKENLFAENKLFATLDSTVRKVVFHNIPFLLTDTVGFIRKLPTTLIESFKSTLDEITEADLLIHVVDISNNAFEDHISVVKTTLAEIGASDKPVIIVFNKIDRYVNKEYPPFEEHPPATLEDWRKSYMGKGEDAIFISAIEKTGVDFLRKRIYRKVADLYYEIYPNHEKYELNQLWLTEDEQTDL